MLGNTLGDRHVRAIPGRLPKCLAHLAGPVLPVADILVRPGTVTVLGLDLIQMTLQLLYELTGRRLTVAVGVAEKSVPSRLHASIRKAPVCAHAVNRIGRKAERLHFVVHRVQAGESSGAQAFTIRKLRAKNRTTTSSTGQWKYRELMFHVVSCRNFAVKGTVCIELIVTDGLQLGPTPGCAAARPLSPNPRPDIPRRKAGIRDGRAGRDRSGLRGRCNRARDDRAASGRSSYLQSR
jgi:hypothetical protein